MGLCPMGSLTYIASLPLPASQEGPRAPGTQGPATVPSGSLVSLRKRPKPPGTLRVTRRVSERLRTHPRWGEQATGSVTPAGQPGHAQDPRGACVCETACQLLPGVSGAQRPGGPTLRPGLSTSAHKDLPRPRALDPVRTPRGPGASPAGDR